MGTEDGMENLKVEDLVGLVRDGPIMLVPWRCGAGTGL